MSTVNRKSDDLRRVALGLAQLASELADLVEEDQEQPPEPKRSQLMTAQEVADELQVGRTTAYRMLRARQIGGAIYIGGSLRVDREAFNEWRKNHILETREEADNRRPVKLHRVG